MTMRLRLVAVVAGCLGAVAAARGVVNATGGQNDPDPVSTAGAPYRATLDQYCVACHNGRTKSGGLALDAVDLANVPRDAATWERVLRKLNTRAMPPAGVRRPDEAGYDALAAWLETRIDRAALAAPNPGHPLLHRLNRAEYANAIRDLLDLEVDVTVLLPADDSAYGFDNISDALGVSPALQERYLSAAEKISEAALGDPSAGKITDTYRVRQDLSQDQHIEGLPFGTLGGTLVRHTFPMDGEYDLQVRFFRTNFGNLRGLEHPHAVEVTLDGARVRFATIGGDDDLGAAFDKPTEAADAIDARFAIRVPVKAGPHTVGVSFVENLGLADTTRLQPFLRSSADTLDWTGRPHVDRVTITGPFNASGPGDTPARRKMFVCRPSTAANENACARQIIAALTRHAYRQPLKDADLEPILEFYKSSRRDATFERGIQSALQLILASPRFVFRIEQDPPDVPPGGIYRISDVELASRLSFFLWSTIPDEELLTAASQGKLRDGAELERQVRRMLADPKSSALVSNFAGQWLLIRNLKTFLPNSDEFPDFDDNLRQAFARETELFFESVMREDRNVVDLLTADYSFVNERLARHYGIPGVYGSQFRRVVLTDDKRRGLLGKGSLLAVTSHATRTSPVLRGKWVLENILGTPPAPPPPDVPTLKEPEPGAAAGTMRQRMVDHRANPACASCHKVMDPIGFAMENFDAVGAWRARDAGTLIDASGDLADGTKIDGVVALRQALVSHPNLFVGTLTEKLLTYALGRGLDFPDMPAVRAIVASASRDRYRFSSIVSGIVSSAPFQMRVKQPATDDVARGFQPRDGGAERRGTSVAAGFSRP
jgi:mono/diheme cytochrome c family protein